MNIHPTTPNAARDTVAHARAGRDGAIRHAVSADDVIPAAIPSRLWAVIEATPGWFPVTAPAPA